jgi:hypothetical protein
MEKTNEAILETLRKMDNRQASMDADMEKDRQYIQNLAIKVEEVVSQMAELRRAINLTPGRVRDRVAEAVEPVINSSEKLTTQIKKKRMVVLQDTKTLVDKILGR